MRRRVQQAPQLLANVRVRCVRRNGRISPGEGLLRDTGYFLRFRFLSWCLFWSSGHLGNFIICLSSRRPHEQNTIHLASPSS